MKKMALVATVLVAAVVNASAQNVYKKGYAGNVEAGALVGNSLYASLSTVHGFSTGKAFFIGLGAKFDAAVTDISGISSFYETHYRPYSGHHYAAAFLDAQVGFSRAESKFKIALDLKAGPSYDLVTHSIGAFCRPSAVCGLGSVGISAGVDIGAFNYSSSTLYDSASSMFINYAPYIGISVNF